MIQQKGKTQMKQLSYLSMCAWMVLGATPAVAEDAAPAGGKSICEIVGAVESQGYTQVSEVSFDDGEWKVEAYKDGKRLSLQVDPDSGKIASVGEDDDD